MVVFFRVVTLFCCYFRLIFIFAFLLFVIQQISTLAQHRSERSHSLSSERVLRVIGRVGQAVNLSVERFVTVGETIADDNPEIKQDMYDACKEARSAGKMTTKRERENSIISWLSVVCV